MTMLRILLLGVFILESNPALAQWIDYPAPGVPRLANGKPNLTAPAPKTPDGKPDLSGIWQGGRAGQYGFDYDVAQKLAPGELLPAAIALRQQRVQDFRKESPLAHCFPVSIPFLDYRGLSRIVQTPALTVILYESPNSPHRTIFTDGRPLPKDPDPTWLGYSAGHWEQDTLVVETIGFNNRGWLDVGGTPQTESLKLTERYHRRDFGHLEMELTFNDPKTFRQPFSIRFEKVLEPDTEILEDVCENERDRPHLQSGLEVPNDVLAKYAGTYEFAKGRRAVVAVSAGHLTVDDPASPLDRLFVARTPTRFLSSVSQVWIEFAVDSSGKVTQVTRGGAGAEEKGTPVEVERKPGN